MSDTKIEWCDRSDWNPVVGCSKAGPACQNCYALRRAVLIAHNDGVSEEVRAAYSKTIKRVYSKWEWTGKPQLIPERLPLPLTWPKKPYRAFVNSMGDLFHENAEACWVHDVLATIKDAKHITFIVLTKRPKRMRQVLTAAYFPGGFMMDYGPCEWPLPNLQLGVSVWDQASADVLIPDLLETPAAVRGVSIEPMLGPVDLTNIRITDTAVHYAGHSTKINALTGVKLKLDHKDRGAGSKSLPSLDHVIVGGETGPGARRMAYQWPKMVRDQCQDNSIPLFYKGIGTWTLPKKDPNYMLLDGRKWEELP